MLRGGFIIIVALVSVFFLGRKLYRHHIFGLSLVIIGISLIGVAAVTSGKEDSSSTTSGENNQAFGVTLICISLIL